MAEPWQTYNREAAFQSLNKIREANISVNLDNYSTLQNMSFNGTVNSTNETAKAIFTPITDFWASPAVWGSWFYVVLIFFTVGMVYVKSQNIFRTSIVMLLMSLLAVVPSQIGAYYIPSTALHTLYILTGLSVAGILYTVLVGD